LFKLSKLRVILLHGVMNCFDCRNVEIALQLASIIDDSQILSSAFRQDVDTPQNGSGPTKSVEEPILAKESAFSFPSTPQ